MEQTVAQRALELFTPIPTENFISGAFSNGVDKCCGVGHWVRLNSNNPNDYGSRNCTDMLKESELRKQSRKFLNTIDDRFCSLFDIADINNDSQYKSNTLKELYPQETPKDRCIALVNDMIIAGF